MKRATNLSTIITATVVLGTVLLRAAIQSSDDRSSDNADWSELIAGMEKNARGYGSSKTKRR
jgi:hypothetical protein